MEGEGGDRQHGEQSFNKAFDDETDLMNEDFIFVY